MRRTRDADRRSNRSRKIGRIHCGFDSPFDLVGKFETIARKKLDAVIGDRIVRGADDDAGGRSGSACDARYRWRGHDANQQRVAAHRGNARDDRRLQHAAGDPSIPSDDERARFLPPSRNTLAAARPIRKASSGVSSLFATPRTPSVPKSGLTWRRRGRTASGRVRDRAKPKPGNFAARSIDGDRPHHLVDRLRFAGQLNVNVHAGNLRRGRRAHRRNARTNAHRVHDDAAGQRAHVVHHDRKGAVLEPLDRQGDGGRAQALHRDFGRDELDRDVIDSLTFIRQVQHGLDLLGLDAGLAAFGRHLTRASRSVKCAT